MKAIKYFACIFSIAISSLNHSQPQNYNYFSDIFLFDSLSIWAVEKDGLLWHTIDGGTSWSKYQSSINHHSLLHFTSYSKGWRITEDEIYFTSNTGKDWYVNFEPDLFHFRDIKFLNDSTGFALGFDSERSKVFRTISSGQSWTTVFDSSLSSSLHHIHVLNEQNIWLLRGNVIYKSTDLGESWTTIYYSNVSVGYFFSQLNMIDESFGIMVYNYDDIVLEGRLLITTDGGYTWETYSNNNFSFGIIDIYFPTLITGWVADNNLEILYTSNAGSTWDSLQNQQSLPGGIRKFAFIDTMRAWAITFSEILYTTDGWHTFNIMGTITDVFNSNSQIPAYFTLSQNYPNPFNPTTRIKFTIPTVGTSFMKFVKLKVYDVLGKEISTLVNEEKPAGTYDIEFDGTGLPSGIYFYQLKAGDPSTGSGQSFVETKKMLLLK